MAELQEQSGAVDSTPNGSGREALAANLRAIASQAAETVGGGVALIFVASPDDDPPRAARLRAAAGFALPQAARNAAGALADAVQAAIDSRQAREVRFDALGDRAAAGVLIQPLFFDDRVHGALAVGSPAALAPDVRSAIDGLATQAAVQLDHHHLREYVVQARPAPEGEKSEELLKLSEALFAQDIELLRKDEKLGKIEKLKNDFIEKMSRELRTPLNSIIEAIISVLTGENDALSDSAKASLRSALDQGTAFQRTLQNILDLWRIKQGELPVEIQDVNFRECVDEAIFSVQDSLDGKPLTLEQHLTEPFPKIRTDLAKINQILFLLLDNAVKFTPGGKIEISARLEDDRLICDVQDTGVGICPDDQQFIFDEFYQVDESSSPTYSGAGLGLTLVRDLVVLLDGELAVWSDVGHGTKMSFRIPVQAVG